MGDFDVDTANDIQETIFGTDDPRRATQTMVRRLAAIAEQQARA